MEKSHAWKRREARWLQLVIDVVVVLMMSKFFVDLRSMKKTQAALAAQTQRLEAAQAKTETLLTLHRRATANLALNSNFYSQPTADWNVNSIITEAQTILKNFGFYADRIDGIISDNTRKAICAFQRKQGLPVTGGWLTFEIYLYLLEYQAEQQENGEAKS